MIGVARLEIRKRPALGANRGGDLCPQVPIKGRSQADPGGKRSRAKISRYACRDQAVQCLAEVYGSDVEAWNSRILPSRHHRSLLFNGHRRNQ